MKRATGFSPSFRPISSPTSSTTGSCGPAPIRSRRSPLPAANPGRRGCCSAAAARARRVRVPSGCAPRRSAILLRLALPPVASRSSVSPSPRCAASWWKVSRACSACTRRASVRAMRCRATRSSGATAPSPSSLPPTRPTVCAARSSMPPGATSSPSGADPTTPGTCCSSACDLAPSRKPSSPRRRAISRS